MTTPEPDDDVRAAVERHVGLFNRAVESGDFAGLVANFTEDAVMRFTNVPVGPFEGRGQIADGYAAQPPDDTMTVTGIRVASADTAVVSFAWDAGGTGTMTIRWHGDQVAELDVAFVQ